MPRTLDPEDLGLRIARLERLAHDLAGRSRKLQSNPIAYTPALTATGGGPTMGTGAVREGWWSQAGDVATVWFWIKFGTAGVAAGSGTYEVTLPTDTSAVYADRQVIGSAVFRDESATQARPGVCRARGASPDRVTLVVADETTGGAFVTSGLPWVWAASDEISGQLVYLTPTP